MSPCKNGEVDTVHVGKTPGVVGSLQPHRLPKKSEATGKVPGADSQKRTNPERSSGSLSRS